MLDDKNVRAEVYKKADNGVYYVKIKILDLGMYISGITVRKSHKDPDGPLWVQMPYYGPKFSKYIEWDGSDNATKNLFELRARTAVEYYENKDRKVPNIAGRGP